MSLVHQNTVNYYFGKETSLNLLWVSIQKGLAMLAILNLFGTITKRSSLLVQMDSLDSGMLSPSTKDNQMKNSTFISSRKRRSISNPRITHPPTSIGFKLKMIIGLFRMLWDHFGNTILILIKEISFWHLTQENSMILQYHLSTIALFQQDLMAQSDYGTMEIEKNFIIVNSRLKVKQHA